MMPASADRSEPDAGRLRFVAAVVALTVLALVLRVTFYWGARIEFETPGDIHEYVAYAWNLVHHFTFSSSPIDDTVVVADSFRGPGYPAFLAIFMLFTDDLDAALSAAIRVQIVLGAMAVPLTVALIRQWLQPALALAGGLLVALWPHAIVFSSTLLSETVFGLSLLVVCLSYCRLSRRSTASIAGLTGLLAGCAYLINPVFALFPPIASLLLWKRSGLRVAMVSLLVFFSVAGLWTLRGVELHSASSASRASVNFVEGSWPQYHAAYNSRFANEISKAIIANISEEEQLIVADRREGIAAVFARMSLDPAFYLQWYLLKKPYSLWSWDVRIGWGDIYFLITHESPFDRYAFFRVERSIFRAATPFLFAFALLGALTFVPRLKFVPAPVPFAAPLLGWLFVYLTLVHTALQADPRYAIAYRPIEIALALGFIAFIAGRVRGARGRASENSLFGAVAVAAQDD